MPARATKPDRTSLYLLGGLAALVAVAVFVLRRRGGSLSDLAGQSPSVRAGDESGAQQPSGGASTIPAPAPNAQAEPYGYNPNDTLPGAAPSGDNGYIGPADYLPPSLNQPVLSPLGPTTSHLYGTGTLTGPSGPVIDQGYAPPSGGATTTTVQQQRSTGFGGPQL